MANLTIVIDDVLLRSARIKAVTEGTSVNEICRQAITLYAGVDRSAQADAVIARFRALQRVAAQAPSKKPAWPGRERLYEEMLAEPSPAAVGAAAAPAPKRSRR